MVWYAVLFVLFYVTIGLTEGYHWADDAQRRTNIFISPKFKKIYRGILDYHVWRMLTHIAVFLLVWKGTGNFLLVMGWNLIGTWLYERMENKVASDTWFTGKQWNFWMLSIWRPWWLDSALGLVGITCLLYA